MDDRVRHVASTLRCPVCQDLSVADSPSLVARQIRAAIARRLRVGQSDQEIRDFFVARFGPSILLTPQGEGIDLMAWIAPALLFAAGLALLGGALRRWSRPHPAGPEEHVVTVSDRAMLERELKGEEPEWA
jgi:cytochrome c-type biogenesis protein CcmH